MKTIEMFGRAIALALPLLGSLPARAADDITYIVHEPPKGTAHPPLIVLLHGSGADEHDMIGLWHDLPSEFVVISPRAPFHDAAGGNRWYRKGPTQDADIAASRKVVDVIVANAVQRFDADPTRVFLGGFSQGAVMTYAVALHEPGRFRGAAVLSGTLFPSETAGLTAQDRSNEAFFVAHGTADPRIPFAAATAARAVLERLHVPTTFHAYPGMGHAIDAAETRDLSDWLSARVAGGQ